MNARRPPPALRWFAASMVACSTTSSEAAETAAGSAIAGLLQAGFGLIMVLVLILGCAWLVRRAGVQRHGSSQVLKVIAGVSLGQRERIVIVEVGDSWLVLGIAAGSIRTLHTLPAGLVPNAGHARTDGIGTFSDRLSDCLAAFRRTGH